MNTANPGDADSTSAQTLSGVPVLTAREVHDFLAGIDTTTLTGLHHRAVIGLMAATACGPGAIARLAMEDLVLHDGLLQVLLRDRDGLRSVPCPPAAQAWLQAYLDRAGLRDPGAPVFRKNGMRADTLSRRPITQREIFSMVVDRAEAAGVRSLLTWGAFKSTGLSLYLANGAWTVPA